MADLGFSSDSDDSDMEGEDTVQIEEEVANKPIRKSVSEDGHRAGSTGVVQGQ